MAIWKIPLRLEELNQRAKNTLSEHLGIEFIEVGDRFLVAKMAVSPKTVQPLGIVHGGASAALAETVASAAGNYVIDPEEHVAVGLDLNINHLKPVSSGAIFAKATPFHLGKTTQVWEIQITSEEGTLTAIARLTLAIIEKTRSTKRSGSL